jgi:hypothetical protein
MGILPQLNLTLDMVIQTQQNSTKSWISWAFAPAQPNIGYGQSNTTELHQIMD